MYLYVEVNQNGRDDKLNLNEIFFLRREWSWNKSRMFLYTAFIQSKFKILDDLSSLKKKNFFFVKFKDMEVGIFLKQMTRSDPLCHWIFLCCYFGYFGLIYISSLKNKIHLQQNMLSHSKKKECATSKSSGSYSWKVLFGNRVNNKWFEPWLREAGVICLSF